MTFIMLVNILTQPKPIRRKPSPKMIEEALSDHNLDPERCFLVGDKITDLKQRKKQKLRVFYLKEANLLVRIEKILKVHDF